MPKLFLPYHLKKETNNEDYVEVEGSTLREVIENLEKKSFLRATLGGCIFSREKDKISLKIEKK